MNRGLEATKTLRDIGKDGNAGHLDLGLSASYRSGARAYLGYSHRLTRGDYNLAAFANAFAGMSRVGGHWNPDFGATAGLRLEW